MPLLQGAALDYGAIGLNEPLFALVAYAADRDGQPLRSLCLWQHIGFICPAWHRPCLLPLTPEICTLQAVAGTQAPTSFDHLSLRLQIQNQLLASLQVARLQLKVLTCLAEAGQHIG